MSVTGIESGAKKKETLSNLKIKVSYKDGSSSEILCNFMGHSQENPMMMTFISVKNDEELPVAIINCDEVKEMVIDEI